MKTRRWYVPMHKAHMDKIGHESGHAYACMIQDYATVLAVMELLDNEWIDAVLVKKYTGEYSDIYVSYMQGGHASYSSGKQWFKVVEK